MAKHNGIFLDGAYFKDEQGRILHLRGVNLSGSTKLTVVPDGATHLREGFFDHQHVSFVGRPFPLEEADEHFTRLRQWGLTFLRFLVSWEAIEHEAPGVYDTAYLDYMQAVVEKAGEYGFTLFIDPHQDVWSRFSGGDGAPGWTLEKVGLDMRHFHQTGAAIVHQTWGDPFPRMIWASNYAKLATATMFTLFFGGNDFAPKTQIDGVPVQEFLQGHFIGAMQQVVKRLKGMPHVIGYDTLNEPSHGFIGFQNIATNETTLDVGHTPTPYQSMRLGMGYTEDVPVWTLTPAGPVRVGHEVLNQEGVRAWLEGYQDIWLENGAWNINDEGTPYLLRPDYFAHVDGRKVDFARDYLMPFANRYAKAIREIDPDAIIFFEVDAMHPDMTPPWREGDFDRVVYAPHWYDGVTLFLKRHLPFIAFDQITMRPHIGMGTAQQERIRQIRRLKHHARDRLPNVPTVIGEIGIPYDLNGGVGWKRDNWRIHERAVNSYMQALEANRVHFTLWNYTPQNTNERGDLWNGEDLSIFSRDQQSNPDDINSGGRALRSVVRPYAIATAGEPVLHHFNPFTGHFRYAFRHDEEFDPEATPTVFYLPNLHYGEGCHVYVSDGHYHIDPLEQRLYYYHSERDMPHRIHIKPLVTHHQPERDVLERVTLAFLLAVRLVSI
jgi:hypothetical protein